MFNSIDRRRFLVASAATAAACGNASAQIAERPTRIVVGYPAGGSSDVLGRLVASEMAAHLRQRFIVDNKPGAGGNIGAAEVAKAAKDGKTLLLGDTGTLILVKAIYKNLPFDPDADFVPVGFVAETDFFLVVHKDLPAQNMREFVEYTRSRPGTLSYASPGNGTSHQVAMEIFKARAGINIVHVPYKGAAPAITDLIAGQIPVMLLDRAATMTQVRAGRVRALAILAPHRIAELPDVPTVAETGYPGVEASVIWALVAPRGTPSETVLALSDALRNAVASRPLVQKLNEMGLSPRSSSPVELGRYLAEQNRTTRNFVRSLRLELG